MLLPNLRLSLQHCLPKHLKEGCRRKMITTAFLIKQLQRQMISYSLCMQRWERIWVKDQQGGRKRRALIDEWIGASLAREMSIPVPDWEAIQLIPEIVWTKYYSAQSRKLTHGVCFGSNNIQNMIDFSDQTINLKSKRIFDQVTNPEDFIRIAIFDLGLPMENRNAIITTLLWNAQPEELTFYANRP